MDLVVELEAERPVRGLYHISRETCKETKVGHLFKITRFKLVILYII